MRLKHDGVLYMVVQLVDGKRARPQGNKPLFTSYIHPSQPDVLVNSKAQDNFPDACTKTYNGYKYIITYIKLLLGCSLICSCRLLATSIFIIRPYPSTDHNQTGMSLKVTQIDIINCETFCFILHNLITICMTIVLLYTFLFTFINLTNLLLS